MGARAIAAVVGTVVLTSLGGTGCSPPAPEPENSGSVLKNVAPDATVCAAASNQTKAKLDIAQWCLFRGQGGVYTIGYSSNGKALRGLATEYSRRADGTLDFLRLKIADASKSASGRFALYHQLGTTDISTKGALAPQSANLVDAATRDLGTLNAAILAKASSGATLDQTNICASNSIGALLTSFVGAGLSTGAALPLLGQMDGFANTSGLACMGLADRGTPVTRAASLPAHAAVAAIDPKKVCAAAVDVQGCIKSFQVLARTGTTTAPIVFAPNPSVPASPSIPSFLSSLGSSSSLGKLFSPNLGGSIPPFGGFGGSTPAFGGGPNPAFGGFGGSIPAFGGGPNPAFGGFGGSIPAFGGGPNPAFGGSTGKPGDGSLPTDPLGVGPGAVNCPGGPGCEGGTFPNMQTPVNCPGGPGCEGGQFNPQTDSLPVNQAQNGGENNGNPQNVFTPGQDPNGNNKDIFSQQNQNPVGTGPDNGGGAGGYYGKDEPYVDPGQNPSYTPIANQDNSGTFNGSGNGLPASATDPAAGELGGAGDMSPSGGGSSGLPADAIDPSAGELGGAGDMSGGAGDGAGCCE